MHKANLSTLHHALRQYTHTHTPFRGRLVGWTDVELEAASLLHGVAHFGEQQAKRRAVTHAVMHPVVLDVFCYSPGSKVEACIAPRVCVCIYIYAITYF